MRSFYKTVIATLICSMALAYPIPASALIVRCDQCTEEYPCATLFQFEDIKFVHYVYCSIDENGKEKWDTRDKEKFDMFYFESPDKSTKSKEVEI